MKKHLIDFPENNISIESFYDRLRPCYDSIMQFGDRVLVAQMNKNKKFQKEQLGREGYTEFKEFYKESLKN